MLIKDCENCKYCVRMVSAGLGVRCQHPKNLQFNQIDPRYTKDGIQIPLISNIKDCTPLKRED